MRRRGVPQGRCHVGIVGLERDRSRRMANGRDRAWVGVDVGKRHHWVCVVDADGAVLLSAKLVNDEAEIGALLASVRAYDSRVSGGKLAAGPTRHVPDS